MDTLILPSFFLFFDTKNVLLQWKPCVAAVIFHTCRNIQWCHAVSVRQHSFHVKPCECMLCMYDTFDTVISHRRNSSTLQQGHYMWSCTDWETLSRHVDDKTRTHLFRESSGKVSDESCFYVSFATCLLYVYTVQLTSAYVVWFLCHVRFTVNFNTLDAYLVSIA